MSDIKNAIKALAHYESEARRESLENSRLRAENAALSARLAEAVEASKRAGPPFYPLEGKGPHDRVTPYREGMSTKDRIDEIVASESDVHLEMMDDSNAFLSVGLNRFWITAKGKKLIVRFTERLIRPEQT